MLMTVRFIVEDHVPVDPHVALAGVRVLGHHGRLEVLAAVVQGGLDGGGEGQGIEVFGVDDFLAGSVGNDHRRHPALQGAFHRRPGTHALNSSGSSGIPKSRLTLAALAEESPAHGHGVTLHISETSRPGCSGDRRASWKMPASSCTLSTSRSMTATSPSSINRWKAAPMPTGGLDPCHINHSMKCNRPDRRKTFWMYPGPFIPD